MQGANRVVGHSPIASQLAPGLPGLPVSHHLSLVHLPNLDFAVGVLLFCHRMSEWPSPLKSPVPTACQPGPGLPGRPLATTVVSFISQITTWPSVFCHRMSEYSKRSRTPTLRRAVAMG
jgi:hypothetical protein